MIIIINKAYVVVKNVFVGKKLLYKLSATLV